MKLKKAVIVDWQGTLVDVSGIRHLVENPEGKKNFPEFHRQTGNCPPIQKTLDEVKRAAMDGAFVAVFTGCSDDFSDVFHGWLARHGVPWNVTSMRAAGDFRKDVVVKREMLAWLIEHGYNAVRAWDDNPNVITLWESFDIPTTVVPGWTGS